MSSDGHKAYQSGNEVADEADGKKKKGGLLDRILPRPRTSESPAGTFDEALKRETRGKRGRVV